MAEHSAAFYALKKKYLQEEPEKNEESAVTQRVPSARDSLAARASVRNEPGLLERLEQHSAEQKKAAQAYDDFFPDSGEDFIRRLGYAAERTAAGALGFGENVTDFVGTGLYTGLEKAASLNGARPNPVSKWAGAAADKFTDNSITDRYKQSITERYNPSAGEEKLGDLNESGAQMAAAILSGNAAGALAGTSGKLLSTADKAARTARYGQAAFGLHAAGGGLREAMQEGATREEGLSYGAVSGMSELAIEKIFGGIPGLGKGAAGELAKRVTSHPVVGQILDIVGEGGEEALSTFISPYMKRAIYDENAKNATLDEIAESAIQGMLMSGAANIGMKLAVAGNEAVNHMGDRKKPTNPVENNVGKVEAPVAVTQEDEEVSSILRQLAAEMAQERTTEQAGAEVPSGLNDLLAGGNRVDMERLTEHHLAEWDKQGGVWVDAANRAYQMRPEEHISQRTADSVSSRKINAFQFDHPELRQYVKRAAADLVKDASLSLNTPVNQRPVRGAQGKQYITEILESRPLRQAMDAGMSRNEIIRAAQDLIADHGQENYAAAKRLELILDEMLTEGYTTVEGEVHNPDTAYIQAKAEIPGYQARQREKLPIWDMEEGVIRAAQAAYDAGRANVPRESAALVDPLQEEAYHAGRLEHIRNMKPAETVEKQETGGYTEGSKNENRGGFDNGRKENQPGAEGTALRNDTGTTEANRREAGETGENGILRSVRVLSRGERPIHDWAEEGLTEEEASTLLAYKSSESYKVNAALRETGRVSEQHQKLVAAMDSALEKLPVYTGRVYRNLNFDDLGGKEAFDAFMAEHIADGIPLYYPAYTSSSTSREGYPVEGDFVAHMEIQGVNGRNLEGFGNNFESEVLFPRNTMFLVDRVSYDENGTPTIYMTEVANETEDERVSRRGIDGKQKSSPEGKENQVRTVSEFHSPDTDVQSVSQRNPENDPGGRGTLRQDGAEVSSRRNARRPGLIRDKNLKKTHLSSRDERRLDALGKALGTEIRFAKTIGDGDVNAMYENGVITVALDADDPVMTSVLHETIHRLRETTPEAYDELADFVWDNMSERMRDLNLEFRSKLYETNDRDALTEEMVADAFGVMLGDGTVLDQFVKDKRSTVEKLRDIVRDIIKAVQRMLNKQNVQLSENQKAAFRDLRQGLQEMEQRFTDALERAQGETKNTAGTGQHSKKSRVQLDEYIAKYGAIPQGENPARTIQMPRRTVDNKKLSRTVRTVMEAQATPEELLPDIEQLAAEGAFSFESYTDKQAVRDAAERIGGKNGVGWEQAQREWFSAMKEGAVSKENTTLGWTLYNHAANSGDAQLALDILDQMVRHQRSAAQALQATRILKKLSPETQLYQVQRSVNNLQEELNQRYGDKKGPTLKVDEELGQRFLEAETQEERDEVLKDIYRDIGRQMPSRFMDKWNGWRYLAMLGNPRTHVRNVLGNAGFAPVVAVKNLAATGIEAAVYRVSGGKLNRNKKLVGLSKGDRALLAEAWGDYAKVAETAMNGGKYDDFANANKYIEQGRVVFGTTKSKVWNATGGKALEKARTGNAKAMEREDMWFSQPHYAYALSQYCKAHGITAEQMKDGKIPDAARQYAVKEAQKATYRDTNNLSRAISALGRYQGNNPVGKGISVLAEGLLPFRKTPANILARGLEYSPFGLMSGVKQALLDVRKGKKTGAEAIDSISAGLTGTGLLILGGWMAAQGLIRGGGSGDEEEKEFAELMGHQTYALELPDGTSVTLDWLAPECLPFFVGVNLWEQTGSEKASLSDWLEAVSGITEPLLEMSCLQSLNDAFDAVGYVSDSGVEGLPAFMSNMAASYVSQGIPTLLGQMERTSQAERMTTYTSKSKWTTGDIQRTLGTASGKIPGLDYRQIPYIDAWGRTERTGAMGERAFNNFLNPAYMSKIEESPMERELLRLYEATGEGGVFPARAERKFTVDQKEKELTAEEYVKYATTKGQTAYKLIGELTSCAGYQKLSDREKVEAVKKTYEYASQTAKAAVSDYEVDPWVKNTKYIKTTCGISQGTFLSMRAMTREVESLKEKGKDGELISIDNSKGLQVMEMIYDKKLVTSLTQEQRETLFAYLGVGKSVRHYNQARVREELGEMRKKAV